MRKVGRPTKYNQEILQKTKDYLNDYQGDTEDGDVIPSIEGLSFYLDIARCTLYDWASQEDKEEFSYTLEQIEAKQKQILLNKGLKGEFNSNITKLALANHGMLERKSTELSGPDGEPLDSVFTIEVVGAEPQDT